MNYRLMGRMMGWILLAVALFMIPALILSAVEGDTPGVIGFLCAMGALAVAGSGLLLLGRRAREGFYAREGLVCVGLCWVLISLFSCLPFVISGAIPHFVDALFETVSGFTTTGASVVTDVTALSKGMLYWRSFSHWLGGMGVLVFILALLPAAGRKNDGSTVHLLRAESSGTNVGKLVPRMQQTAIILYFIYILLTVLDTVFLLFGGLPLLDAVCLAFGTVGTGGFGVLNDSIASYSPYVQWVCTVFMFLCGVNFTCYYLLLIRRFRPVLHDEELRLYVGIVLGSILLIVWNLSRAGMYDTLGETIRHAAFQVSSIVTTTGYATTNFDLWPSFSKAILLCLMAVGSCAGSTGCGIKVGRLLLLSKGVRRSIGQVLHPRRVQVVRQNGRTVEESELQNAYAFLAAYGALLLVSFLVISLDGFSPTTNFTAALACLNDIGPGLEAVGPAGNYAGFSVLSKLMLIVNMLAGRLEIFPVLVLFSRRTWTGK